MEYGVALHLNKPEFVCFVQSLIEIRLVVLEKKILLCLHYLRLENGVAIHLNRLEFVSPKDSLCQVSLTLVRPVVIEKKTKV